MSEELNNDVGKEKKHEVLAALLFCLTLFFIIGLISYNPLDLAFYTTSPNKPPLNFGGIIGAYFTFFHVFIYGLSSMIVPLYCFSLIVRFFISMDLWRFLKWFFYFQLGLLSLAVIFELFPIPYLDVYVKKLQITSQGGLIGTILGKEIILPFLGRTGGIIIFSLLLFISLQGIIPFSFKSFIRTVFKYVIFVLKSIKFISILIVTLLLKAYEYLKNKDQKNLDRQLTFESDNFTNKKNDNDEKKIVVPKIIKISEKKHEDKKEEVSESPKIGKKIEGFEFPSLNLLREPTHENLALEENIEANGQKLIQTLKEFDIECNLCGVESGPVITRYEIQIASGIKVGKVTSLDNDIGLAMRAKSVRIIAPIPGKSAIGIEIPNHIRKMVFFKELLTSNEFKKSNAILPLLLGQDISGNAVIADLAKMPHLLIAGATGAGKSVCINTIVISLLYTLSPANVKIMMVDPKKVELATYKNIPHLFVPLITNPSKVAMGLRCLIEEMEQRYQIFKEAGVRNIDGYNKKEKTQLREQMLKENIEEDLNERYPDKLPYIVAIIDELADLMLVAKSEIETSIVRLAQLSRAVGIHMIVATQRPSVDVVTGLIKANIPARIAFRVSAKVDSRTVLDVSGAEKLLGQGDMLFLNPGQQDLLRVQGAYLEDEEINNVVDNWKKQGEPDYDKKIMQKINQAENPDIETDPLFNDAVNAIRQSKHASTSFLQKQFRIGYNRASRLIDELEMKGIIGPAATGGKTREIYIEENDD